MQLNIRIGPRKKLEALIKRLNKPDEVDDPNISSNASNQVQNNQDQSNQVLDISNIISDQSISPSTSASALDSSNKNYIIVDPSISNWPKVNRLPLKNYILYFNYLFF